VDRVYREDGSDAEREDGEGDCPAETAEVFEEWGVYFIFLGYPSGEIVIGGVYNLEVSKYQGGGRYEGRGLEGELVCFAEILYH
jgi:hypothetical protein